MLTMSQFLTLSAELEAAGFRRTVLLDAAQVQFTGFTSAGREASIILTDTHVSLVTVSWANGSRDEATRRDLDWDTTTVSAAANLRANLYLQLELVGFDVDEAAL